MEVITIETSAYYELITQIKDLIEESKRVNKDIFIQNNRYLNAAEVGAITGYSAKSIKNRKDSIGYISMGGELKFLKADVDKWMMKNYIEPI
ncbi:MAG TPA: hypothetical protein VGE44_14495 [Daejeonella sp.]|uniref:hypothetical protein n=1 Tax=Daejeonella sp. TaxID=2805397 RepID=UPI002ED7F567